MGVARAVLVSEPAPPDPAAGRSLGLLALLVAGVVAGLVVTTTASWKSGMVVVGVVMGVAALARATLPSGVVGALGVRGRALDTLILGALAALLLVLALSLA